MNQDDFQFRFLTRDGDPILVGEPRPSKDHALEDAAMLRRCVGEDGCYAVSRDEEGRFYFHFIGEGGQRLGVSVPYPTPEGLGRAIAALKAGAPLAEVIDRT